MHTADRQRELGNSGRVRARAQRTRSATRGLSQAAIDLLAELDAIDDYPDEPILLDKRGLVTASRRLEMPAGSVGTLGRLV